MSDPRFLLHVTQADRWPAVISNLRNLANQGLSRRVRVMINGTAIYAVQGDNDWTEAMREAAQDGARPRRSRPPVRAAPRPRRIDVTMTTTKRTSSDGAEAVRGDIGGIAPFLPEPGRPGRSGEASAGTVRRRFTGCSGVSIQGRGVT